MTHAPRSALAGSAMSRRAPLEAAASARPPPEASGATGLEPSLYPLDPHTNETERKLTIIINSARQRRSSVRAG